VRAGRSWGPLASAQLCGYVRDLGHRTPMNEIDNNFCRSSVALRARARNSQIVAMVNYPFDHPRCVL
jgi:hypothetical protein